MAWRVPVRRGGVRCGMVRQGQVWQGVPLPGAGQPLVNFQAGLGETRLGLARCGLVRGSVSCGRTRRLQTFRRGMAWPAWARLGAARRGKAWLGMARQGVQLSGADHQLQRRQLGVAGHGRVWRAEGLRPLWTDHTTLRRSVGHGRPRQGSAGLGLARLGSGLRLPGAGRINLRKAWRGVVWPGSVGLGMAGLGMARFGAVRQGPARGSVFPGTGHYPTDVKRGVAWRG